MIFHDLVQAWHIDPRGRPTVTAGSDHYFHTCCLSIRRSKSQNLAIQTFQTRIVIATGGTVGLAEWIIDDTHVMFILSQLYLIILQGSKVMHAMTADGQTVPITFNPDTGEYTTANGDPVVVQMPGGQQTQPGQEETVEVTFIIAKFL